MGSSERIRRYAVIGPIRTYLQPENERWTIHIDVAREVLEDGLTGQTHRFEQPSSSRPFDPVSAGHQ